MRQTKLNTANRAGRSSQIAGEGEGKGVMQSMQRMEGAASARPFRRRAACRGRARPFSWREQWQVVLLLALAAGFILFNVAAGLSPTLTGRCLRCVITGDYHCRFLAPEKHPREIHREKR